MVTKISSLLQAQPDVGEFIAPLRSSAPPHCHLDHFQIGIDNHHIDVALSHQFRTTLINFVRKIVYEELTKHGWVRMETPPTGNDVENFKSIYRSMMQGALEQVHRDAAVKDLLQLLHLVLLKLLLESPVAVVAELRNKLDDDGNSPVGTSSGRTLELHERIVTLARLEPGIRYLTLRRLFKIVQRLESKELRKLRKSVVGSSWVLSKQLLFNPLLHLPNLSSEEFIMDHYPLLCVDREHENYFDITNRIITSTYKDYLPSWAQAPNRDEIENIGGNEGQGFQIRNRELHSGFSEFLDGQRILERNLSEVEFKQINVSWLDVPRNIDLLLKLSNGESGGGWFSRPSEQKKKSAWGGAECESLRKELQLHLLKRLDRAGVMPRAIAAYRTQRLYHQLNGQVSIKDIYHFLTGDLPRRTLVKRLANTPDKGSEVLKALDVVFSYIRRMPADKNQEYTIRYVKDFLVFRRDLKLAYYTYQQMSRLRVLQDGENIKLSRDNGSLYEFRLGKDPDSQQQIKSHAILKADIRGSTEITRQLIEKKLNPATHFSMNFFGPITKLLERFGAQKVFVEGDALILTVTETGGTTTQALTVANSCGLARKILSVMEAQNSQNKAHNLPKLELGLGIAYSNDAPAYLYDEQRKIMISPAINEADRLSSCSAELRRDTSWRRSKRHRVEVFQGVGQAGSETATNRLSYNINGIELTEAAFNKLKSEMVLHKIKIHSRSGDAHYYHVGRFVDRRGSSHWLVVRQSVIKAWREGKIQENGEILDNYFYEIVTDTNLIGRVKDKLHSRTPRKKQADDILGEIPLSLESDI
jgi:class 3 adenylate cyclase